MPHDPSDPWPAIRFDWARQARTGIPEVVFAEGKSLAQLSEILTAAQGRGASIFLTRLAAETAVVLSEHFTLDYDPVSRSAVANGWPEGEASSGEVALVCGGTTDLPVVEEARRALAFMGVEAPVYADVGVAGLWRLLSVAEELSRFRVLIAVAGMEGALFSALGGLVPGLVIAVPAPVGYGVSEGGRAALNSALSSCAPGIVTVNIGNGFGAAAAACKALGKGRAG
ncbi:MAG: nickel pincer cofactor biosynthesis protein LarB [Tropicimonas sp.]|uniref:nickel pincer cofactor biosynthesis protein LarB n=1 Tax=Tropicimonas sp. TaxID=2067044 RepID=UPI003A85CC74